MAPRPADVTIRDFAPGDEAAFLELNEEWIVHYFEFLEDADKEVLSNPHRILAGRGRIFLAVRRGKPVGCCALMMGPHGDYEVAKMAVTASERGAGIGRRLLERV